MDHNAKDHDAFSSELSDRSWLPLPAENFQESTATYDSHAPSLQGSSDCHSIDGSSTASRPSLPSYIADSVRPAAPPGESHNEVNSMQGLLCSVNPLYPPHFNPQLWNYPAFSIPQYGDNLPNDFTKSLETFANNASPRSSDTLPYDQYIPPFGISENLLSQWDMMDLLKDKVSYSYAPFTSSNHSVLVETNTSNPPMLASSSGIASVGTLEPFQETLTKTPKISRRKAPKKPKNARRSGPLDARVREKAEKMRDIGACWRCRKYKKSCSGSHEMCDSCRVPGFRVWPSELGCRRERLESLVLFLLPANLEEKLHFIPGEWAKVRTWRILKPASPSNYSHMADENISSQWTISKREARSVLLFGAEYVELATIAENYQRTRTKPVEALEVSCRLLIATCKLYQCFVRTPDCIHNIELAEMVRRATAVRIALRRTFVLVQQLCLSTKRTDWFPAFLSACLITCTAIVFIDTIIAVPSPVREMIYGDFHGTRADLRNGGYDLLVDLLRASTNGVNPIQQDCWKQHSTSDTKELQYSKDRKVLLGLDTGAMEGLMALRAWQEKYRSLLDEGRAMFAADAYTLARIQAIAGIYKIFDL